MKGRDVRDSAWVERAGRLGLVGKGASFALVSLIALQVAFAGGGKTPDRQGALRSVAREPLGRSSLVLLALAFAGYAVWRFVQGFLDRGEDGEDARGLAKRAGQLGKGALYTGLCISTIAIVVDAGSGGGPDEDKWTARVLDVPLGRWLVLAVGLAILGVGAYNAYRSFTQRFRKNLATERMEAAEDRAYTVLGVAGHAARGLVFALIGFFVARAAWQYDPKEAIGLDGALSKVAQQPQGDLLLGLVAAGLFAYALFCFVQARYRDV